MSRLLLSSLVTLLLLRLGPERCCAQQIHPPPPPLDRASDVREPIFRDFLKHAEPGDICFLSFGEKRGKQIDPPDEYLRLFADLKRTIKRASQAELTATAVRDKCTGKTGVLVSVAVSKKISEDEIDLSASITAGPQNAFGYKVRMLKKDGRWIPQEILEFWVS